MNRKEFLELIDSKRIDIYFQPIISLPREKTVGYEALARGRGARRVFGAEELFRAAQRYAAGPDSKSFGAISVFLQAAYETAPGHRVAASCFHPRPDVESHLLHLVRRPEPYVFPAGAKACIRGCFQQRRKQIGALLRARLPAGCCPWPELLAAHGLSERARPEAIPVPWWVALAKVLPRLA